MYRFGSHVSCAGGLLKGVDRAADLGCDCIQIFVSNPRQWPSIDSCIPVQVASTKEPAEPSEKLESKLFSERLIEKGVSSPLAHASYLINLASPDDQLWSKSLDALVVEWQRAEQLLLDGLVVHPGAYMKSTTEEGLQRIAAGVQAAIERVEPNNCRLLLENTAGQGTCLGWEIEQLGWLIKAIDNSACVGLCWDTCHALAAGYDFRSRQGMNELVEKLKSHELIPHLKAVHINDSAKDCGSRVDRHEHIGKGFIGETGFQWFLSSAAFKDLPMYLETAKEKDEESGLEWDVINLRTLRRLAHSS